MYRFYCPNLPETVQITDSSPKISVQMDRDETRHARRVLRLKPGDHIEVFNGRGQVAEALIESMQDTMTAKVVETSTIPPAHPKIDIAAAIPKGSRAGEMVNQISQLGVDQYIPLQTQRGVVEPGGGKLDQFRRIALESAKQSGRAYLMKIDRATTFEDVLAGNHDLRLFADLTASQNTQPNLKTLTNQLHQASRVLILIGPEGGWTNDERAAAAATRCQLWSLGPHVMRIETAAVAAAAVARYLASE